MRSKVTLFLLILAAAASSAYAKEPRHYQSGKLLQMASVACGTSEKDAKSFTGELLGTDSGHKNTQQLLCQEYVIESDTVTYRIRPKDDKHPVLLPIGQQAQFFLEKDKMKLRVEDLDNKDREYIVVSMMPRTDVATVDPNAGRTRLTQ